MIDIRKLICGIIVSFLLIFCITSKIDAPVLAGQDDNIPLKAAFQASKADFNNLYVNAWDVYNHKYMPMTEISKLSGGILDALEIKKDSKNLSLVNNEYSQMRQTKIDYINQETKIEILIQSMKTDKNESSTYLIINEYSKHASSINDVSKIKNIYKNYNILSPKISIVYEGTFNGEKSYNELDNIKRRVINSINATIISDGTYENCISTTAYTPKIKEYINVAGDKINLNVAFRYYGYDKKTHVLIASPIITSEY